MVDSSSTDYFIIKSVRAAQRHWTNQMKNEKRFSSSCWRQHANQSRKYQQQKLAQCEAHLAENVCCKSNSPIQASTKWIIRCRLHYGQKDVTVERLEFSWLHHKERSHLPSFMWRTRVVWSKDTGAVHTILFWKGTLPRTTVEACPSQCWVVDGEQFAS